MAVAYLNGDIGYSWSGLAANLKCDVTVIGLRFNPLPYLTHRHNNVNPLPLRA